MIRIYLFMFFILFYIDGKSQFSEKFSDGNLTVDPTWTGDTAQFSITELKQLQLNSSGTDTSYIVTPNRDAEQTEWDIMMIMNFNTSLNNYARIYLVSDQSDLFNSLNGYYLQIGGSNDSVGFFKQSGNTAVRLFKGERSCTNHSSNLLRLRVTHDQQGVWHLFSDQEGGYNLIEEGSAADNTYTTSSWFGLFCRYTSGNAKKFFFDDLYCGPVKPDSTISMVKPYDVIIDEIMADPEPANELPCGEYVELYNRSQNPVGLGGWKFQAGSTTKVFPDVIIPAHGFLILSGEKDFEEYGQNLEIFTSSSNIPNDGSTLILKDPGGRIIHSVDFTKDWYRNTIKEEGGWSLEMTDTGNPCGCGDNWEPSTDASGGTPGRLNSVSASNPDLTGPDIERIQIIDDSDIIVRFSESTDSTSLAGTEKFFIDNGIGNPSALIMKPPSYKDLELILSSPLQKGTLYTLHCPETLKDCAGNDIQKDSCLLALPDSAEFSDIVINEILANPFPESERFVELYNRSSKVLDLGGIFLSSFDTIEGEMTDPVPVSQGNYLFFPGDYIVLTNDPQDITRRYYCPHKDFIRKISLPKMADDNGIVAAGRVQDNYIIDLARYSKDMHFPLLTSTEGVSLERISPDRPSSVTTNWHSASASCGFATPGYRNSQFINSLSGNNLITISPAIFSPDNDGYNDVVSLGFNPDEPGYYGSIRIYDSQGRFVRTLVSNHLFESGETISWDGTDKNGKRAEMGIYIILSDLTLLSGKRMTLKNVVVLAAKF